MAVALSGGETRDSRQQVSTSSSRGKIAEPMQAEVVNAEEASSGEEGRTPPEGAQTDPMTFYDAQEEGSMFDANGKLMASAINFDRPHGGEASSAGVGEQRSERSTPQVWDAAQAYR